MPESKIPGYNQISITDFKERLDLLLKTVRKKREASAKARKEKPDNSYEAIANAGNISLRTLHHWRSNNLKTLPRQNTVISFCQALGENPNRFALFEKLPEDEKTRIINQSRADSLGITDNFMEYLKHNPRLEAEFANSIPAEVHEGYTGYQLTDYYGGSRYPDEITAYVIRLIQAETEDFILSRLDECRKMSHTFTGSEARAAFIKYLKEKINSIDLNNPELQLAPYEFEVNTIDENGGKENGNS